MMLFYGRQDHWPLRRTVEMARELEVDYTLIDQADLDRGEMLLEVGSGGVSGCIVHNGVEIPLQSIEAVYARPLSLPAQWSDGLARRRAEAFHELFLGWLDLTPAWS